MSSARQKIFYTEGVAPASQIGDTLEALTTVIAARENAGEESYTYRLLHGSLDRLLKKIVEEAHETTLAAKDCARPDAADADVNHLRYEAADVVYHLLVLLQREGIGIDEFAAELNMRMEKDVLDKRSGIVLLQDEYINRGR